MSKPQAALTYQLHTGQVVVHDQHPGEHFLIDRFEGNSRSGAGFEWQAWVRGIETLSHIPFRASIADLKPIQAH